MQVAILFTVEGAQHSTMMHFTASKPLSSSYTVIFKVQSNNVNFFDTMAIIGGLKFLAHDG